MCSGIVTLKCFMFLLTLSHRTDLTGRLWGRTLQCSLVCLIFYAFLVACWTKDDNTNVPGGVVDSAGSVQACQSACIANASCTGVDWNDGAQTGQKCWLSGPWSTGDKRVGEAPGIAHYDLNRDCAGKNLWLARSFHVSVAKTTFRFNSKLVIKGLEVRGFYQAMLCRARLCRSK